VLLQIAIWIGCAVYTFRSWNASEIRGASWAVLVIGAIDLIVVIGFNVDVLTEEGED